MATIELCDLCSGKAKQSLCEIILRGKVPAFKGPVPPAPPGFKYKDDYEKNSFGNVSYKKVWDEFGRLVSEARYIQPPKRFKEVEVRYDLCELCFEKFIAMLETIKKQYHLEATEMKLIEDKNTWKNPFLGLLGFDHEEDEE